MVFGKISKNGAATGSMNKLNFLIFLNQYTLVFNNPFLPLLLLLPYHVLLAQS